MSSRVLRYVVLSAVALALISCREPAWEESFLRADEVSFDGRYHFDVDFSDSTALYDVSFYTKFGEGFNGKSFPVSVRWTSPSGWTLNEKVYWDADSVKVLYRKDITPPEAGVWDLSVYAEKLSGMLGMGIITEKHDGTR